LRTFRASGLQGFRASGLQGFRAPRVREEVEAEALGALWLHVQAGNKVDSLPGLVFRPL
jgi:hypothetical protein